MSKTTSFIIGLIMSSITPKMLPFSSTIQKKSKSRLLETQYKNCLRTKEKFSSSFKVYFVLIIKLYIFLIILE